MNKEQLIKQLDEFMELNRQCRQDGNDILNKVRGVLTKKNSDDYEKGLNDAWELIRKINGPVGKGGYTFHELSDMFGTIDTWQIVNHMTCQEALAKVEEYEKKKAEEEATKLVPGDYVTYWVGDRYNTAIFLDERADGQWWVLSEDYSCPQLLSSNLFQLIKTGKHIDLKDLFKENRND